MTFRARVVPCLLLSGHGLVKTKKFKDPTYVGDPVNAARIFSEKEADEIFVLDIDASKSGKEPNYDLIADIASECFMPLAYGGGVKNLTQIKRLIRAGIEKVVINSAATKNIDLISEAAATYGSQAIVAGVDVRKPLFGGYKIVAKSGTEETTRAFPE
jgi:imidazole glycerol-phosphate synthase subunit HisF